jgi:predicted nucleic acid-binding protein
VIDVEGLPSSMMLDTGVLLRALGHRPTDAKSAVCRDLLTEAVARGRRILVAAPSLAEITRGRPETGATPHPVPRSRNLVVVAFDQRAAEVAGAKLPIDVLREFANQDGVPLTYLKYDALIVASAVRWGAACLVTVDAKMKARYGHLIDVRTPESFEHRQVPLL